METLGVILGEVATLEMVGMVVMQEVEADTSLIVSQVKTFSLSESRGAFITSICSLSLEHLLRRVLSENID